MRLFILTLIVMLSITSFAAAQTPENVTVKAGTQRSAKRSKLKIKFVSVVDDSRCPEGANCVWAGNAQIKVLIGNGKTSKEFEMNTTLGPKGDSFDGWAIYLEELTPYPKAGASASPTAYQAKFKIVRLTR